MPTQQGQTLPWFPTVMYHRVVDTAPGTDPYALCITSSQLDRQLGYLKSKGYRSVPLQEALAGVRNGARPASRQVVLSFDDGYMDFMTHALPLLQKHGFTATVFLVSGQIGGRNAWDEGRAEPAQLMDVAQIREAQAAGITFGSHSKTHPRLADLAAEAAHAEVFDSKKALQDVLGQDVPVFCYPFGNSSAAVRALAEEAGYEAALGIEQREHTLFNLSRVDGVRNPGAGWKWRFHIGGGYFRLKNRTYGLRRRLRGARR